MDNTNTAWKTRAKKTKTNVVCRARGFVGGENGLFFAQEPNEATDDG